MKYGISTRGMYWFLCNKQIFADVIVYIFAH